MLMPRIVQLTGWVLDRIAVHLNGPPRGGGARANLKFPASGEALDVYQPLADMLGDAHEFQIETKVAGVRPITTRRKSPKRHERFAVYVGSWNSQFVANMALKFG
jgi:hypothetical protein